VGWLVAALASALFMTGLIWFVQVVHYPLFGAVGSGSFPEYHRRHAALTTLVVGMPMLVELGASVGLVAMRPAGASTWLVWASLLLVLGVFGSTALVQVPLHERLSGGFEVGAHRALVASNAVRAILWTAHSGVLLVLLWQVLGAQGTVGHGD
jgi:hypothetical protein